MARDFDNLYHFFFCSFNGDAYVALAGNNNQNGSARESLTTTVHSIKNQFTVFSQSLGYVYFDFVQSLIFQGLLTL